MSNHDITINKNNSSILHLRLKLKQKHYSKENLSRKKVILPLQSSLKFDPSLLVQLTIFIDLLRSFNLHTLIGNSFTCMDRALKHKHKQSFNFFERKVETSFKNLNPVK
jgi:hypothetical protein